MKWLLQLGLTAVLASNAFAQSRPLRNDTLLDMIAALGGDAFSRVREIQTTGRFYTFQRGSLSGSDVYVDYIKLPDAERTEFGVRNKSIQINVGNSGWTKIGRAHV